MDRQKDTIDISKVVVRLAEPGDHEDVKVLCVGALGGRDVLPAKFLQYLKDPLRRHYVAVYKGRVVAIFGGRIIDDGNTIEGGSGRALPGMPGVFARLREDCIARWILKDHPQIKLHRGVLRNEKALLGSQNLYPLPHTRAIVDLVWKEPVDTLVRAIAVYQKKFQCQQEYQHGVRRIHRDDMVVLLQDTTFRERYIPSGILVVDSAPLHLNYKQNLDIIVSDDNRNMFASYDNTGNEVQAMSFGTAIEMDVTMETLRYVIDYYGIPSLNSLIVHTMKHISTIPVLVEQSQTAKDVYVAIFLLEESFSEHLIQQLLQFMTVQLNLCNKSLQMPLERQFVVGAKIPFKSMTKNKL